MGRNAAARPCHAGRDGPPRAGLVAGLLCMLSAAAGASPAAVPETRLQAARDPFDRMTVPVTINGQGPFPFVIDTGADRSVISRELARRLHLPAGPDVLLNSSSGVALEPTATIASLDVGARHTGPENAAILPRDWIGAAGMLGVDAVRDQGMVLDFLAHRMTVHPVARDADDPRAITVNGRNRYGQLILLDAAVNDQPVFVILDTGAEETVVNAAFLEDFADGSDVELDKPVRVISVTGGGTPGRFATVPLLTLGDLTLHDLRVVRADLYTFRLFRLQRRPAMLLGMNVLRQFDRVEVDYRHRLVHFTLPRRTIVQAAFDRFRNQAIER